MTQRDYILRIAEDIGRALAQILYHQQPENFQGAHDFIDEQFRQMLSMGAGFVHTAPEETLLALLTSMGELDTEKCWLLATLLKADGELYEAQANENESYYSYLKALNLFLAVMTSERELHRLDPVVEVEGLLYKLSNYELPVRTKTLLLRYFEQTGNYASAERTLHELLEDDPHNREIIKNGRDFYRRLLRLDVAALEKGGLTRNAVEDALMKLMQRF